MRWSGLLGRQGGLPRGRGACAETGRVSRSWPGVQGEGFWEGNPVMCQERGLRLAWGTTSNFHNRRLYDSMTETDPALFYKVKWFKKHWIFCTGWEQKFTFTTLKQCVLTLNKHWRSDLNFSAKSPPQKNPKFTQFKNIKDFKAKHFACGKWPPRSKRRREGK